MEVLTDKDKRYKAPNGKIVSEEELKDKYGDKFNELVKDGTFIEVTENVYKSPNGKYEVESILKEKYGDKFSELTSNGTFKLDYSSEKKKEESKSTAKDPDLVSAQEVEVGSSATPQNDEPKRAPKGITRTTDVQLVKDIDSGKLNGRIDELQAENDDSKKSEKETDHSVIKENFRAFQKGSSRLGQSLAATPELLYDVFAIPQNFLADKTNLPAFLQFLPELLGGEDFATDSEKFKELVGVQNSLKDYYSDKIDIITKEQEEKDKPITGDIITNIRNGNVGDAFRLIGKTFSESLPTTLGIMLSGGTASSAQVLTGVTTVFGAQSNEEYKKENPEMSANERVFKSLGQGLAEGVFASIGSAKIGVAAKEILAKEGAEQGSKILKVQLIRMYTELLKKYSIPTAMLGEGIEEAATQMTQNAIDGKPIMEGVPDSFISGMAGGGVFGVALEGFKKVSKNKTNPTDIENVESIINKEQSIKDELALQVKEGDLTSKEAKDHFDNWEEIKNNLQAVPEEFTTEQKAKAVDVLKEKKKLEKEIEGKEPALVEDKKARIEELNNELKNIKNTEAKVEEVDNNRTIDYENGAGKPTTLETKDIEIKEEGDNKFVISENGNRIGHVQYKVDDKEAKITLTGIFNPTLEGKGIGEIMYNKTAKSLKEKGLTLVSDTERSAQAEKLWKKLESQGKAVFKDGRYVHTNKTDAKVESEKAIEVNDTQEGVNEGKSDEIIPVKDEVEVDNGAENQIKEIELERDTEIAKLEKPNVKLQLVSVKDLVNSKDPIGNKNIHNDIKDRYKKIKALMDCL